MKTKLQCKGSSSRRLPVSGEEADLSFRVHEGMSLATLIQTIQSQTDNYIAYPVSQCTIEGASETYVTLMPSIRRVGGTEGTEISQRLGHVLNQLV